MKLTTKSEYSILAMLHMARHSEQGYVKIRDIIQTYNIPKKYLELLCTILKQNGYLKTRRGSEGGYKLARPADQITLAQIIRLMDGALAPTESVSTYFFSDTPISREPQMMAIFKEIRDYIAQKLENLTLADFVREEK